MKKTVFIMIISVLAFAACSTKSADTMRADESMRQGMALFERGKYDRAIPFFENTLMEAENPEMAAKAQLFLADAYFLDKKYSDAIPAYETFLDIYGETPDADTAQLRLGLSHYAMISTVDRDMRAAEGALTAFVKLRDKNPSFAREFELNPKIVELRGMLGERELYVAKFYFRIKEPESAERRIKYLIEYYSDTEAYEEGLLIYANWLAEQDGREAEAVNYYQKLIKERPESKHIPDVARALTSLLAKLADQMEKEEK